MRGSHPRDPGSNPGRSIFHYYRSFFKYKLLKISFYLVKMSITYLKSESYPIISIILKFHKDLIKFLNISQLSQFESQSLIFDK